MLTANNTEMKKTYEITVKYTSTSLNGLRKGMHIEYSSDSSNPFAHPKDQKAIAEEFQTQYKIKVLSTDINLSMMNYKEIS